MRIGIAFAVGLFLVASALDGSAQVSAHYRPGDEAAWIVEQGQQRLGHCASRYEGEVELGGLRAHHFRDQAELELAAPGGTLRQRYTVERWLDDAGHPLRFELRAQIGDAKSSVEGTFAAGKAELVVRQGPTDKPVSVGGVSGVFLLANNFVAHLELALKLLPAGEKRTVSFFSGNALTTFPLTLTRTQETPGGGSIVEDSLGERLELSPELELTRVEIPAQRIVFRRVDERIERFAIELAARAPAGDDLAREEVRIVDGDVSLAGTITRLEGAAGRLPAVTFLSGSGPQDREGFSSGIDLGTHEILDRLTREGFLVLRVDDRGVGASTGPTQDIDFGDLVEDGRRAVRFLRARPDVDPERVAVLGHSEGGLSAPVLAAEEPLAAIVLMAAPGRPLEDLLREQLLFMKSQARASPSECERFEAELDLFLEAIARGEEIDPDGTPPELAAFLPARAWLASHLGRDPLPFLAKVRCPVLILQGAKDVQVSAERDAPKLAAALAAAKHPDHELVVFPTLDHLFKKAGDPPSELDYLKSRPVDAAFLDKLAAWLRARLMK
jgi:pimeloyl-ACP methyl ester carboxylesterase